MDNLSTHVFTVNASAGSGKTYCLANRYVQILTDHKLNPKDIPLKTILAITFTNKAALEMKERILEFVKASAISNSPKAEKIIEYILKNYNFFQVQTIDSFINSILYGCAYKLQLSANFSTKDIYSEYLSYSLDRLIDEASSDKKTMQLFRNFLKQYIYIENKAGWFPKKNIISRLNVLFLKSNKYSGEFLRSDISSKDIVLCKNNILKSCIKLNEKMPDNVNAGFVKSLRFFIEKSHDGFGIEGLSDFFKRENFPMNKGAVIPKEVEKLWKNIRADIRKFCELESLSAFNYYIDIFNKSVSILNETASAEDVLFLDSLNKNAARLFAANHVSVPELYYRLATRFRHFLIDEFQDTSRLQWENIFPMVEEALSTGGSLFYVGDAKQAIYRFRAGDASLMDSVKVQLKSFNLKEDSLLKNYRSRQNIVEFNNSIFSRQNLSRFINILQESKKIPAGFTAKDKEEILNNFKDSVQSWMPEKPGGYVLVEPTESEDLLKLKLVETLKSAGKRFPLADIAILARKNEDVGVFTSWLLENNIPVESEKTLNIKENPYIKEIVSLLRFLNSPIDNVSFASFILGDIFSKASKMTRVSMHDFIFNLGIGKSKKNIYLYKEFRSQFKAEWEGFFEEFFKNVGFVPLYEMVVSIYSKFNIMGNFGEYQGFFMKLVEFIKEEQDEYVGISGFLDFFDTCQENKLFVNVTKSDSVKVLTVHKAKGLEFDAVIVPLLEMNPKVDSEVIIEEEEALSLLRMKKRYAEFSPYLSDIYKEEYKKSFIDELNNVYVALTRAATELYVFLPERSQTGFNVARALFADERIESGKALETIQPAKKTKAAMDIPLSEYKDWIGLLKSEFSDEGLLQARGKIFKGKVLHYMLSFVGNLSAKDKETVLKQAQDSAKLEFPFVADFKEYRAIIDKLLNDKKFRKYFYTGDADVYLEKEVVNSYGDTKRIDRLVVTKSEAVIIDYKSTREKELQEQYHKQVCEYMSIVKQIYPGHKVRGILIYLDELTAEEING